MPPRHKINHPERRDAIQTKTATNIAVGSPIKLENKNQREEGLQLVGEAQQAIFNLGPLAIEECEGHALCPFKGSFPLLAGEFRL